MTEPKGKPFEPDRIVTGLLALQWIVLPLTLLVFTLLRPTFDPAGFGISRVAFLMIATTSIYFVLMLFGWICLRVYGGRRVGFIAIAIVHGLNLAVTATFVFRGRPLPLGLIEPVAVMLFAVARLRGWGPKPT